MLVPAALLAVPVLARGLNVAEITEDLDSRFPIITGCLDACGNDLPACVSQCQVCVEMNKCQTVELRCNECLEEVKETRQEARNSSNLMWDSGGQSLIHDGLRTKLYAMKREQLKHQRELLDARDDVLEAQRAAEFAEGRRNTVAIEVGTARRNHESHEGRVKDWEAHHDTKIESLEGRKAKLRKQREEKHKQLKEAQDELREAKKRSKNDDKEASDAEDKEQAIRKRIRTLKNEIQKLKDEEAKMEDETHSKKKDAAWVDRELKKDAQGAEGDVLEAKGQLRQARAQERHAVEVLDSAKNRYRKVAAERARYDDKVEELEAKLADNPLPVYIPKHMRTTEPTTTTNMWTPADEKSVAAGLSLSGLLVVFGLGI